jgi:hypothetical protein
MSMSRGWLLIGTLILGIAGGTLLGGCGSGQTKTVSVAESSSVSSQQSPGTTASTTATAPASTSATTSAPGGATSGGAQGSSHTRTAPEPAFTEHGASSTEGLNGATEALRSKGYTANDTSVYRAGQTLRVLVGTRTGSGDGYDQQAFFFLDGKYIGTDTRQPSASVHVVAQSDTEVTLAYSLYRAHDSLCCPSGGQAKVRFQLDNGKLTALDPIPSASSGSGLSRQ